MRPQIFYVEDDADLRRLMSFLLQKEQMDVHAYANGKEALDALATHHPDVMIVDLMMPVMDGYTFVKEVRARPGFNRTPIIILSAKEQMVDKYESFSLGADDYITKPFDPLELLFRVRSFLRLTAERGAAAPAEPAPASPAAPEGALTVGRVTLVPSTYEATVEGRTVTLTRLETEVLAYLMRNADKVVGSAAILQDVLNSGDEGRSQDAVQAHIRHLRRKLEANPDEPQLIVTVGRKGYRFMG